MVREILFKLGIDTTNAKDGLKKGSQELKDYEANAKKAKQQTQGLLDVGGKMPGVMGQAANGISALKDTFKTLAAALVGNPLGIVITGLAVAVGSLIAIFKDFAPITDYISDKVAYLGGAFRGLQTSMYSLVTTGKLVSGAITEAANAAENASRMQRNYTDNLSAFNLKQAQLEAQIDKLLKQAKNKSISDKEANELIKEARRLQDQQIQALKQNAREETAILVEKAKAAGATYEQILAIQRGATIESLNNVQDGADEELIALQENYKKRVEELGRLEEKTVKIENAEAARNEKIKAEQEKAAADKLKREEDEKKRKEETDKTNKQKHDAEVARLAAIEKNDRERKKSLHESEREEYAAHIADLKGIKDDDLLADEERFAAIDELNKKGVMSDREAAEAKVAIAQKENDAKFALLEAYSSMLNSAADLAGRDTAAGKALAVASATISTYTAIAKNLAAFAGVPIPGYAIAQAIATGVAGLAAVKNILAVKVPGNNGGGAAPTPNMTLPPVTRPSSGFTMLGNENPIRTTNEGDKVKVFVTESDITTSQNKVSSIQAKATIG